MLKPTWKLRCSTCEGVFDYDPGLKLCPLCKKGLTLEVAKDASHELFGDIDYGIWKYDYYLPNFKSRISLGEGNTPLHVGTNLAKRLSLAKLYIKDETVEPTGSYLDRSSALFVTAALDGAYKTIHVYTTGNLGASLAAYSAKAALKLKAILKEPFDPMKLYQMIAFGAELQPNEQTKDDAILAMEYDPLITFGKRTLGIEILTQLKAAPDYIIMPMGEGGLIYETSMAVKELGISGIKLIGVQAEGCAPIVEAFNNQLDRVNDARTTKSVVFDLSVKSPKYGDAALNAIRKSGGIALSIPEHEIVNAMSMLAEQEGLLVEPAASLSIAAIIRLQGLLKDKKVVSVLTGSGLKDPHIIREMVFKKSPFNEESVSGLHGTKLLLLRLLYERDMYAYEIWAELRARNGASLSVASVYQHLNELVNKGYLQRGERKLIRGRYRQYYSITQRGRYSIV